MNDDLTLLISYICKDLALHKVVLVVPHGMNSDEWVDWKYFLKDDIQEIYLNALPLHVKNHIHKIIEVENIFGSYTEKK